ncbi:MAG: hypothetical protein H6922_06135 [Pseudomonadaceae bacterium]|nr:hypothetical protein [Pseudomonadaceae bacterium]
MCGLVGGGVLAPVPPADWRAVHGMMVAQCFPDVPHEYDEAAQAFARVCMVTPVDDPLGVVFVLGEPQDGITYLDVVCSPDMAGRWASRRVMRALAALAFGGLKLRAVWVQAHGTDALRAALAAGFVPATDLDVPVPVLVMTPHSACWLLNGKKERENGKFV